jgi:esterase
MRLHCQILGEGFPLIVLHGFLGSSDNWRSVSKSLAGWCKVYSLDLRNHGSSPHSAIVDYPVMSEDVCEFMDDQKLSSVFLLGHSMGGKVAMQLALDFPKRVQKLVVVDIAPRAYEASQQSLLSAALALDLKAYRSFGEVDDALMVAVPQTRVRQLLLKNLQRDNVGHLTWKIDLEAIAQNYDKLTRAILARQKFDGPTCFVRGGRSNYIREDDIPMIREKFPQAKIKTIANAGHWVHADAAEEFISMVTDFLTET